MGWALGVIVLIAFALITSYSQWLVLETIDEAYAKTRSYGSLALKTLGKGGLLCSSFFTSLTCIIANAAHMSTVTKMLHDITSWYYTGSVDYPFSKAKRAVTMSILLVLVLPFCFSTSLRALRHISSISVATCIVLSLSMAALALMRIGKHGLPDASNAAPAFVWDGDEILSGSAALCFAFSSIVNVVGVAHEMRPPPESTSKAAKPVYASTAICLCTYALVSVTCALAWGKDATAGSGNVLYLSSPPKIIGSRSGALRSSCRLRCCTLSSIFLQSLKLRQ